MNLEEFETHYRNTIEQSLNQLQTATLLMVQLEHQLRNVGKDLQELSLTLEEFVSQQDLNK